MMRTQRDRTHSGRGWLLVGRAAIALIAAVALCGTAVAANNTDLCKGRTIRQLGVHHPVAKKPIKDYADLQKRLAEFEGSFREAIALDPTLGPGVADAVIAAVQSGYGAAERNIDRREVLRWMAYRPKKGVTGVISPPCLDLKKDYKAIELIVSVPEPEPPVPDDAKCAISATRNCEREGSTIAVDISGSSAGAKVTMAAAGAAAQPVSVSGMKFTVADPQPYSLDYVFTVSALGSPQGPRYAKEYRFLVPKACGNLALVGEERKEIAPGGKRASCEKKSTTLAQCKPWCDPMVDPKQIEVHHDVKVGMTGGFHDGKGSLSVAGPEHASPFKLDAKPYEGTYKPLIANCADDSYKINCYVENAAGVAVENSVDLKVDPHDWAFRPFLFYFDPSFGGAEQRLALPGGQTRNSEFTIGSALGLGASLEKYFNRHVGLEGALMASKVKTKWTASYGTTSGSDSHNANFFAATLGPNFHLFKCSPADLFIGPFIGIGGLADPNYWVGNQHFAATFSNKFVYGAHIGLDVPFKPTSQWGFYAGLRYLVLPQKIDSGEIDVDPLLFAVGLSYKF